jgi:hypothetical protein
MTLRALQPINVIDANITASNVALETVWSSGTYSLGDQARVGERLFEVSAATTTEEPSSLASDWFDAGPANRYAAFDIQVGIDQYRVIETVTSNSGSITYTLEALTRVSGIAFFGLKATNIQVIGTVSTSGDVLNVDYDLKDATLYEASWWRWSFVPKSFERKYLNLDVNIPQGSTFEISISNVGGTAEVGTIALGIVNSFGTVIFGSSRALKSRSVKKTEGTLTSLKQRSASARVPYMFVLQRYEDAAFWRFVDDVDGVGVVFSASDNHPELSTYGVLTSATTKPVAIGVSRASIEVEAL